MTNGELEREVINKLNKLEIERKIEILEFFNRFLEIEILNGDKNND